MAIRAEQMAFIQFPFDPLPAQDVHDVGDSEVLLDRVSMMERQRRQASIVPANLATSTLVINCSPFQFPA